MFVGRRAMAVALALAMGFAAVGCGGDDSSDEATARADVSAPQTVEREDVTDDAADDDSDDDDSDDDGPLIGSGPGATNIVPGDLERCLELSSLFAGLSLGPLMLLGAADDDEIAEFEAQLEAARSSLPNDLQADYALVQEAYAELFEIFGTLDIENNPGALFDPATSQRLEEAGNSLDDPAIEAAVDRISAYIEAECT